MTDNDSVRQDGDLEALMTSILRRAKQLPDDASLQKLAKDAVAAVALRTGVDGQSAPLNRRQVADLADTAIGQAQRLTQMLDRLAQLTGD